ncbi:uncharacterized protein LOC126381436 [Pectinophora gossypiella]|uniref:uncharacterized protein LOC126381436 n=1 Tax=Pectinophora gossypiella TaxID=13191 RepID=UPI00214E7D7B|nr:uncharacterized protein LOC126381436 [Pectinophora gossypiella]
MPGDEGESRGSGSNDVPSELNAVSVTTRIPDFWTDQPRFWFARANAILKPKKLGDEANFDLLISKMSKDTLTEITDLVYNPPATGKCETLKTRLLALYEDSKHDKIKKLLRDMDLGDQRPSQLLRRMKDLAKDNFPDSTLRILWEDQLPSQVRAVLAVTELTDLEALAKVADNVCTAIRPIQITEVAQQTSAHSDSTTMI